MGCLIHWLISSLGSFSILLFKLLLWFVEDTILNAMYISNVHQITQDMIGTVLFAYPERKRTLYKKQMSSSVWI